MSLIQKIIHWLIRSILRLLLVVHDEQIARIPQSGPLLVITNHVNFLELPLVVTHFGKRPLVGVAKVESWDNPIKRYLFDMWNGIPVRRGEADRTALRQVLDALAQGKIVGLAPEGTRSYHGGLQEGQPGVLLMALRSGAPVQPLALYGHEIFWQNLRKLKRTHVYFAAGNPFYIEEHEANGERAILSREVREKMIREVMYQMAALLPPKNRGMYADLENATSDYLRFEPGVTNNLERATPAGY
ncbi:MAG: lysophospholipid acyltransferase family protein [Anaerolineaceae bacterium]